MPLSVRPGASACHLDSPCPTTPFRAVWALGGPAGRRPCHLPGPGCERTGRTLGAAAQGEPWLGSREACQSVLPRCLYNLRWDPCTVASPSAKGWRGPTDKSASATPAVTACTLALLSGGLKRCLRTLSALPAASTATCRAPGGPPTPAWLMAALCCAPPSASTLRLVSQRPGSGCVSCRRLLAPCRLRPSATEGGPCARVCGAAFCRPFE